MAIEPQVAALVNRHQFYNEPIGGTTDTCSTCAEHQVAALHQLLGGTNYTAGGTAIISHMLDGLENHCITASDF